MKKVLICTLCPKGCRIQADDSCPEALKLDGYGCKRGKLYAAEECFAPKRILTGSVRVCNAARKMLPVRTTVPIPKDQLFACMKELKKVSLEAPVTSHQVILSDILGTGADLVASMELERRE